MIRIGIFGYLSIFNKNQLTDIEFISIAMAVLFSIIIAATDLGML